MRAVVGDRCTWALHTAVLFLTLHNIHRTKYATSQNPEKSHDQRVPWAEPVGMFGLGAALGCRAAQRAKPACISSMELFRWA